MLDQNVKLVDDKKHKNVTMHRKTIGGLIYPTIKGLVLPMELVLPFNLCKYHV